MPLLRAFRPSRGVERSGTLAPIHRTALLYPSEDVRALPGALLTSASRGLRPLRGTLGTPHALAALLLAGQGVGELAITRNTSLRIPSSLTRMALPKRPACYANPRRWSEGAAPTWGSNMRWKTIVPVLTAPTMIIEPLFSITNSPYPSRDKHSTS